MKDVNATAVAATAPLHLAYVQHSASLWTLKRHGNPTQTQEPIFASPKMRIPVSKFRRRQEEEQSSPVSKKTPGSLHAHYTCKGSSWVHRPTNITPRRHRVSLGHTAPSCRPIIEHAAGPRSLRLEDRTSRSGEKAAAWGAAAEDWVFCSALPSRPSSIRDNMAARSSELFLAGALAAAAVRAAACPVPHAGDKHPVSSNAADANWKRLSALRCCGCPAIWPAAHPPLAP